MDGKPSEETRRFPGREAEQSHPPLPIRSPNATTVKAMKELDEGGGKRFANAEELFEDLGI